MKSIISGLHKALCKYFFQAAYHTVDIFIYAEPFSYACTYLLFRVNIYQLTPPDPPLSQKNHDPPLMAKFYDPPLQKLACSPMPLPPEPAQVSSSEYVPLELPN